LTLPDFPSQLQAGYVAGHHQVAWHHYMARECADALTQSERVLRMEHSFHWGYFFAGWALERLGRGSEAIDALTNAVGSSWISPSKSAPDGLR